jgi:hypothetical protein
MDVAVDNLLDKLALANHFLSGLAFSSIDI